MTAHVFRVTLSLDVLRKMCHNILPGSVFLSKEKTEDAQNNASHFVAVSRKEQILDLSGLPLKGFEKEIDTLREIGNQFHDRGWSIGTSSNYSVVIRREPLELLITASGKDKSNLLGHDFVRVDSGGLPICAAQPKASAETLLHIAIAEQPDVGSVMHTHSIWGTLLSDFYVEDNGFGIEGYEMLKGLAGVTTHEHSEWVQVFDNTQDISVLAEQIRQCLNDFQSPIQHGFLIWRHGLYTWGRNLDEAKRHIEIFEFLFECVARRLTFAGAMPVSTNNP